MGTVTRLEGRAPVLALVAATAAALAYAYTFTFSQFVPYDDEGYFTVTVQHLLAGHRLYDDVPVPYGPFFYLSRWLIYGALRVPLVTDAVRLVTIGHWLLCAALPRRSPSRNVQQKGARGEDRWHRGRLERVRGHC